MRVVLSFLLAMSCLLTSAHASGKILPDACGKPDVIYKTKHEKANAPPRPPLSAGNARIVMIQVLEIKGTTLFGIYDFTTRFGLDGKWVGAAGNNSYLAVDVTAGEHHLCADVQSTMDGVETMIGTKKFTAEAGKVYYFQFTVTKVSTIGYKSAQNFYASKFDEIEEDAGQFRTKALPVSISKPKED